VILDLHAARRFYFGLLEPRRQTKREDGDATIPLINPILRSENARTPGLNAIGCPNGERMAEILSDISRSSQGHEGHVRFHLGVEGDTHRVAVDAFQHKEGGFTLICVDSVIDHLLSVHLAELRNKHSDVIKGVMHIPTDNLAHNEGCVIFAVHTLNAMHDYQPHFLNLHREIYAAAQGRPAPQLAAPRWEQEDGTHVPRKDLDSLGLLPGKFFKHMQVTKPGEGETRTLLDEAEAKNPELKDQPVNKKGQTLRQRFESFNTQVPPAPHSRADRTASLDQKRVVLIDRAIAHYEGLAGIPRIQS
jgi:hypothetical protein